MDIDSDTCRRFRIERQMGRKSALKITQRDLGRGMTDEFRPVVFNIHRFVDAAAEQKQRCGSDHSHSGTSCPCPLS